VSFAARIGESATRPNEEEIEKISGALAAHLDSLPDPLTAAIARAIFSATAEHARAHNAELHAWSSSLTGALSAHLWDLLDFGLAIAGIA
jgi:hypothetical protein